MTGRVKCSFIPHRFIIKLWVIGLILLLTVKFGGNDGSNGNIMDIVN
jgi:hypothetical protein